MKKLVAVVMSALMLAGCASSTAASSTAAAATTAAAASTAAASSTLSMGLGSVTSISGTDATADKAGKITINTTYVGVVLDANKTIKYVYFDVAQNAGSFDTTGKFTSDATAAKTKKEKGDDYHMKQNSLIGKEWYEQVEALEKYSVGKTVADVVGMKTEKSSEGSDVAADADLKTSMTIGVTDFLKALQVAADNATPVAGLAKVGTSSATTLSLTDASSADKSGSFQSNVTFAAVALDKDGKILCTLEDVSQQSAKCTIEGKIDGTPAAVKTKMEKGSDYGMKAKSGIGKEWNEQATAWMEYTAGKTIDQIKNLATETNSENHVVASDADLKTSVTIGITDLQNAVVKAAEAATAVK